MTLSDSKKGKRDSIFAYRFAKLAPAVDGVSESEHNVALVAVELGKYR